MLERKEIQDIASGYEEPMIGCFGSHSALEVASSAKRAGFKTYLIAQEGRDSLYTEQYSHLFDKRMMLKNFYDLMETDNQSKLAVDNVMIIPNRSFFVYLNGEEKGCIENDFRIPIFGSRNLLAAEDRDASPNQYDFMIKAGIPIPKVLENPKDIDEKSYPVIVKVLQKDRPLERAFPVVSSYEQYEMVTTNMLKDGLISKEDLEKAVIEEFLIGPYYNANSHALTPPLREYFQEEFPGSSSFDFVGFGRRDQTSESGFRNLPANVQLDKIEAPLDLTMIEIAYAYRQERLGEIVT